jgi:hypothetical protein
MKKGGHGLPKVSLGPALYTLQLGHSLKKPYGRFRGGPLGEREACSCLVPLGRPTPYAPVALVAQDDLVAPVTQISPLVLVALLAPVAPVALDALYAPID